GTWIAVNDRGLVFALLNRYASPLPPHFAARPTAAPRAAVESRGRIIPALAASGSITEALTLVQELDQRRYNAFHLLVADGNQLLECWTEGERLRLRRSLLQAPEIRTSS